jgi:ATP-dependent Clp protease protease subunit
MKKPNFTQLVVDNKALPRLFEVTAKADGGTRIDLFDVIDDYYGVSATAFVSALNSIKDGDISLHINSPGGDVFAARAMVAAIAAHPSTITAYIDGLAASAASYVATACDSVVMQDGSMMMVHCASCIVWGNSDDMIEMAGLLEKIDASIASDYARKTGKPAEEMMALMTAETWMSSADALQHGFADKVVENEKGRPKNRWVLDAYANAPPPDTEPTEQPSPAGFFMTASNANKLKLHEIL